MASEVVGDNMHMDTRVFKVADFKSGVIEVIQHHMPISHSPCRRRYKGPLPSCSTQHSTSDTRGKGKDERAKGRRRIMVSAKAHEKTRD